MRKQKPATPRFIPGLKLSRLFYEKEVRPILHREFPRLRYSAALIGWGSEVLGFDTPISRDHHWGPRLLLFLGREDYARLREKINRTLSLNLRYEFMGYSTNYSQPESNGVRHPVRINRGPVNHLINIYTTRSFLKARLGVDPGQKISVADWLTFPQQRLLELTSGAVYHDGLAELEKIRERLSYYPRDVWLYMLAAQWKKISQEEAFVGRAGDVRDELGSRVVAARIVRELMRLGFLMERKYVPYSKWLGKAFGKLEIAKELVRPLKEVLQATSWTNREKWLSRAYSRIARQHNALQITKPLSIEVSNYFQRPYAVIHADRFAEAIKEALRHPELKKIEVDVGSIDQFTDSTTVIENLTLGRKLRTIYTTAKDEE
jgi:hypothetical protein